MTVLSVARMYVDALQEESERKYFHTPKPLAELEQWGGVICEVQLFPSSVHMIAEFPDHSELKIVRVLEDGRNSAFNSYRILSDD